MDIKYYAFALFIAGLICLIAILCRVLFADLRRQHKLLDEKESKLLELYRTVESVIEDFEDQSKAAMDEIREYESRAAKRAATAAAAAAAVITPELPKPQTKAPEFKPPVMDVVESNRMRVASEVLARAERMIKNSSVVQSAVSANKTPAQAKKEDSGVFQRLFDDASADTQQGYARGNASGSAQTQAPSRESLSEKSSRNDLILELAANGNSAPQIARELGITQNEVNLVIGLTGKRS